MSPLNFRYASEPLTITAALKFCINTTQDQQRVSNQKTKPSVPMAKISGPLGQAVFFALNDNW